MAIYNFLSEVIESTINYTNQCINDVSNYVSGLSNEGYFISGSDILVPASQCDNVDRDDIDWSYNQYTRILSSVTPCPSDPDTVYNLTWLSASMTIHDEEYSMDQWYPQLQFVFYEPVQRLTPAIIASCWSTHSHVWAHADPDSVLTVIDHEGESHAIPLYGEYDNEEWLNLVGMKHVDAEEEGEDADDEAEEEEEAEDGEETEAEDGEETEEDEEANAEAEKKEEEETSPSLTTSDGCPLVPLVEVA